MVKKKQIAPCTRPAYYNFPLIDTKKSVCLELHACQRYKKIVENRDIFTLLFQISDI